MLKTIFQSKEIRGAEKEAIAVKSPLNLPNKHRRPKVVSFHRQIVEGSKANDSMSWSLQLKRSSASTNVSVLNLTESESFEFERSENTQSSSSDSEGREEHAKSQNTMKNSGLKFAKDSVINLKGKNSKLSQKVHRIKTESAALSDSLEQRQQEVEELDKMCNKLEEKLNRITKKMEDICKKRDSLNNLKYEFLKDMSAFQSFPHSGECRSDTTLLWDLNRNMASLSGGLKELQHSMETSRHEAESNGEVEKQEMTILMSAMEEIRDGVAQICVNFDAASTLLKSMQRTVLHMDTRIESFISPESSTQKQQEHLMHNIQELGASRQSSPSL
ncbi:testis-specific serine kinase substrate [Engystomops pustulosus]|uniref:testis-specific serine kinase substrate n=1 Tax=Engystomops pustulosus TaxID=76066 RepID=UPI003AFB0088